MSSAVRESARLLRVDSGKQLFDFGKAAFGRLLLSFESPSAGEIRVELGECLKSGMIDPAPGGYRRYYAADLPVTCGHQSFEVIFPPHVAPNSKMKKCLPPEEREIMPFRYVQISGAADLVEPVRLAYFGGFDDSAADFVSSSAALDEVWEFCKYSIKATNAFECYIDGDRERLPYEGDAYINQLGHFCCDCAYDKAKRTIDRLLTTPTWPIEWRLLMPVIVRDYVLYSGDLSMLPSWKRELESCLFPEKLSVDGLLPERFDAVVNNEAVRTIIDWPAPERDGCEFSDFMTVPNCCLYAALLAMNELYGEERYSVLAAKVKGAIRSKLMKDGIFVDSSGSSHHAVHSLMFPVVFDVAEAEEYPLLAPLIESRGMACSVYGAQHLLDSCFICGLEKYAQHLMSRRGKRSWLGMIEAGSTITMEAWGDEFKPNQDWNHAWGAAPANIIPRRLCGIRPLKPGFAEFIVEPKPGDLEFFRFRHPTLWGAVTVEYRRGNGFTVALPDGSVHRFTGKKAVFRRVFSGDKAVWERC